MAGIMQMIKTWWEHVEFFDNEQIYGSDQVVNGVIWSDLADLNEPLGEGGHYVTHEVVPHRDTLDFQQLFLFLLHLGQVLFLCTCV